MGSGPYCTSGITGCIQLLVGVFVTAFYAVHERID